MVSFEVCNGGGFTFDQCSQTTNEADGGKIIQGYHRPRGNMRVPSFRGLKPAFKPPARSMEHSSFHNRKCGALGLRGLVGLIWNMSMCKWTGEKKQDYSVSDNGVTVLSGNRLRVFNVKFNQGHLPFKCTGNHQETPTEGSAPQSMRGWKCGGTAACVGFRPREGVELYRAAAAPAPLWIWTW